MGSSEFKYVIPIVAFAVGIIGMFAVFTMIGPLPGILMFWVLLGASGYALYRLLTEDS